MNVLDRLSERLKSKPKLEAVGRRAVEMIRRKLHRGESFAPLSPATQAFRGSGRPLQDTGSLRDSITHEVVDGQTVSVGTNKRHARILNNGGVIRAKREWLWIPGPGVRQLQRRYGYEIRDVLSGVRKAGFSPFRKGRTVVYRDKKGRFHVLYFLKKSVEIPKRRFFYLTDQEINLLAKEAGVELEQL